ncbi:hypothetical protein [Burkholderia sp. SIMBA_062]|uniref:hypothetical protein n=1 Tax=Burkholderia sp. SIMBA_062 TaxID=3085803 RepID=UPI0039785815
MKAIGLSSICWMMSLATGGRKTLLLSAQEGKVVMEMTAETKPNCAGRYLIDLPASTQPIGHTKFEGVMVNAIFQTLEEFERGMRAYSGEAPGKAGIAMSFAHGHGNPGRCNDHFGYDHQASYGDEHGRSLYATMYAIIKIAQQARWHKKESA